MTTRIRARFETTTTDRRTVDFGITDDRGRAIGALVIFGTETRSADESAHWLVEPETLGAHVTALVRATRNGEPYGASQSCTLHPTREAAEAAAEKKLTAARKRNAKKFAA